MPKNRRESTILLISFLFCPFSTPAAGSVYRFGDQHGKNQVMFFSEAPIENIEGEAAGLNGMLYFDPKAMYLSGYLSVTVNTMRTGLAMRDNHMRSEEWLNAAKYPTIGFKLLPLEKGSFHKDKENVWSIKAKGIFSLKGKQKEVVAPVLLTLSNERLVTAGQFLVNLAEFGITGPTAMNFIGARVGENVRVKLNLIGVQSNEAAPASLLPPTPAKAAIKPAAKKVTPSKKKRSASAKKRRVQ